MFVTANQECQWDLHVDQFEDCQYTVYHGHEQGHYDWHYDAHPWPYGDDTDFPGKLRKLSATILMNDPNEYTGGEFELDGGIEHNERKTEIVKLGGIGDMVIFSSTVPHRVLPVTEGTRKSMVVWALGPKYK
jgi:PKHD-type hydroxylase